MLGDKILGLNLKNATELQEKIQSTIEREPDFLKKVETKNGKAYILHLEFQLKDEPKMIYRMAEYRAILQRKYELPVKQFVIYLGEGVPRMETQLKSEEQIINFELKNLHNLPIEDALGSEVPEEIVLSILADYPKANASEVISQIISKLKEATSNEAEFKKYLQQLLTLSRIRKLERITEEHIEAMPITYDVKKDFLYNQGKQEEKRLTILEMCNDPSLTVEQIARFTRTSIEYVQEVIEKGK